MKKVLAITLVAAALLTGCATPLNDITPLDTRRKILALFSFVLPFLLATPRPFG